MRELIVWFRLAVRDHLNIACFLGYITDLPEGFGLVFSYFSNKGVMSYLDKAPGADKEKLVSDSMHSFLDPWTHEPFSVRM